MGRHQRHQRQLGAAGSWNLGTYNNASPQNINNAVTFNFGTVPNAIVNLDTAYAANTMALSGTGTLTINGSYTMTLSAGPTVGAGQTLTNNATIATGGAPITVSGGTLNGAGTYNAPFIMTGGTISGGAFTGTMANNGATGAGFVSGGTISGGSFSGAVIATGGTVTVSGGTFTSALYVGYSGQTWNPVVNVTGAITGAVSTVAGYGFLTGTGTITNTGNSPETGRLGGTLTLKIGGANGLRLSASTSELDPGETGSASYGTGGTFTVYGALMLSAGTINMDLGTTSDLIQMYANGSNSALKTASGGTTIVIHPHNLVGGTTYNLIQGYSSIYAGGSVSYIGLSGLTGYDTSGLVDHNNGNGTDTLQLTVNPMYYTWNGSADGVWHTG